MDTKIIFPTPTGITVAADLLRAGDIVAIPTETVYGLAANALSASAVAKIYAAKGRPANNPLIVHVDSTMMAQELAAVWPKEAQLLAEKFWPGPLTLVLPKIENHIPDITTAGGYTVAIRCPRHPVALELISECGFPLAAPSANRSNALSPTTAAHVLSSLGGRIPLILDGGACEAGIESTVLSLAGGVPNVLRPGTITAGQIAEILQKDVSLPPGSLQLPAQSGKLPAPQLSPGQLPIHYAPSTPLYTADISEFLSAQKHISSAFSNVVSVTFARRSFDNPQIIMPECPSEYANKLYAVLHELDGKFYDAIILEMPPDTPDWQAIRDRLKRASLRWVGLF